MAAPDGLLVVDKPPGWTSHDVVARCRRLAGTRKVGHAGTLDPMATGVLVLGVGRATRILGYLALTTKGYDATIRLGQTTLTDDAEGSVLESRDASALSDEAVEKALETFHGDIDQVPSSVSAVKIDGRRAYKRVREGENVELASRRVRIDRMECHQIRRIERFVDLDVTVQCSAGTYIRALARDLGARLEVGGHLTALRRTRVSDLLVDDAHTVDELGALQAAQLPVVPLDEAARDHFTSYVVEESLVVAVSNGRQLHLQLRSAAPGGDRTTSSGPVAVLAPDGRFLALYEQRGPVAHPVAVFPSP
jgi:tRNA pseudouridine55 synthase